MYGENEFILLSGIQHFVFCRRQWALIHIEQQWSENYHTVDGRIMHERVHNPDFREKRGELIVTRAMEISSSRLGITGECDAVEFRQDKNGVTGDDLVCREDGAVMLTESGRKNFISAWQKRKYDEIKHPFLMKR